VLRDTQLDGSDCLEGKVILKQANANILPT